MTDPSLIGISEEAEIAARLAELDVGPPLSLRGIAKPPEPLPLGNYEGEGTAEVEFQRWAAEKAQLAKNADIIKDDPAQNPPTIRVDGHGVYKDAKEASWDLTRSRYDAAYDALVRDGATPETAHAVLRQPNTLDPPAIIGAENKQPELSLKDGRALLEEHRRKQDE